jgi:N-acetyl-anhydromuramyl-L-alanine amidase AmpD
MNFNGRATLISEVQKALGLHIDGIAGVNTWRAIEGVVTGQNTGTTNDQRIKNVQKKLKLKDDGKDGPVTWNAIKTALMNSKPSTATSPNMFTETIKLSQQTTGPFAQKITPSAIVLHHTSGNYEGSINWTNRIYNEKGQRLYGSYHCIIARDGRRTITNEDTSRAYHAGKSSFRGRSSLNNWSLGVAWERDTYSEPLSDAAIKSALEYILPRMKEWNITPAWVTDHRTVSPGRKTDIAPKEFEKFMKALNEGYSKK